MYDGMEAFFLFLWLQNFAKFPKSKNKKETFYHSILLF